MNPKNLWPIIVLCTLCPLASRAAEQNETVPREYQGFAEVTKYRGVIDDPDGYVNYYEVTQAAARGDKKALKTFFGFGGDGAAEEEHIGVTSVVIHLIGDDAFARFLREQPREFRKDLTIGWELGIAYPFDTGEYFRQHFPKSAKLLFPGG